MERLYTTKYSTLIITSLFTFQYGKIIPIHDRSTIFSHQHLHSNMERLYTSFDKNRSRIGSIYIPIWKDYTIDVILPVPSSYEFTFQYGKIIPWFGFTTVELWAYLHSNMERLYVERQEDEGVVEIYIPIWKDYTIF